MTSEHQSRFPIGGSGRRPGRGREPPIVEIGGMSACARALVRPRTAADAWAAVSPRRPIDAHAIESQRCKLASILGGRSRIGSNLRPQTGVTI